MSQARRMWILLAIGYAILFAGGAATLIWTANQESDVKHIAQANRENAQRLNDTAAGLCSALLADGPDPVESARMVIAQLARGVLVPLPTECRELLRKVRGDTER